jgi:hypothetical protein|nr:MAG TPA: hypothetical protein [Caudoviricetes sp.]
MTTLYCVHVEEPNLKDSAALHYYVITVESIVFGWRTVDISAITEAAKSLSHCEILRIMAGFSDGILFDYDSICEFLGLYAPDPKLAIQWLGHASEIIVRPTFEQIHAMG